MSLAGFCPVDKPAGPTSHDIVRQARKALGIRRIGHTGTLDPFASGLLLLGVGSATRLIEYLDDLPKEYTAVARLGVQTTTDDPEGDVLERSNGWQALVRSEIAEVLRGLLGDLEQRPPSYSAKRIAGERAYTRARAGETVELEPVRVTVHEIELVEIDLPEIRFRARVSTGTYIRALARDLGAALGVGAHLTALRRTAIGPLRVERAIAPEALGQPDCHVRSWIPALDALAHLPRVEVDRAVVQRLVHGQSPEQSEVPGADRIPQDHPIAVVHEERLVCVGRIEGSRLRPSKVFERLEEGTVSK